jgi:YD repeat-containing protein
MLNQNQLINAIGFCNFNKDIGNSANNGIAYNHLNLPYKIWVAGTGTITYTYDATGNKLEKRTVDSPISKTVNTTLFSAQCTLRERQPVPRKRLPRNEGTLRAVSRRQQVVATWEYSRKVLIVCG